MKLKYRILKKDCNLSIKLILKTKLNLSNNLITTLKKNNLILLNNIPSKINTLTMPDDILSVDLSKIEEKNIIKPQNIPINIIYEDDYLIALNKQSNIVVHPTYLYPDKTLSNGLLYYFNKNNINILIRPVSRLDKNTTGIILFAKNPYIQESLITQMKNKIFKKNYIALLEGTLKNDFGTIDVPIKRNPNSIIERCVSDNGLKSVTHYKIIKKYENYTLVSFDLETGRTHQIRVHSKYIGHPIVGDSLYNNKSTLINRQVLHSNTIKFRHPISKKALKLSAPIPHDIENILIKLNTLN
jgi:23S rRNA pseudouridine1911/1915/1917 synthase